MPSLFPSLRGRARGEAFNKMKIDLLDDRAMDVKTEIDTINLLLKQEGLTKDDWSEQ